MLRSLTAAITCSCRFHNHVTPQSKYNCFAGRCSNIKIQNSNSQLWYYDLRAADFQVTAHLEFVKLINNFDSKWGKLFYSNKGNLHLRTTQKMYNCILY